MAFHPDTNETLAHRYPDLSKSWHPEKNGTLTPEQVATGTHLRVWWICERGHEWEAAIYNRARGTGCPYCAGQKVTPERNLGILYPEAAKEWHPSKNSNLTAYDVTPKSNKKAWWVCQKGHEWEAVIASRAKGHGCPYCSGKYASPAYNLAVLFPQLLGQWDTARNGSLSPNDVSPQSNIKAWWVCERGHEWEAMICNRVNGSGCPYCSGQKVSKENSLATVNPELADQWHPTKNHNLSPNDVTARSHKKIWWLCKRGHSFKSTVYNRAIGTGCPYCSGRTSDLEVRVYVEMKGIFGQVEWRKKIFGYECDVYLPEKKIGIEVDSYHWHKDKTEHEILKNNKFEECGVKLFRIRDARLSTLSETDIFFSQTDHHFVIIERLLNSLSRLLGDEDREKVKTCLLKQQLQCEIEYKTILSYLPGPLPDQSLMVLEPTLAMAWNYIKNGPLTPEMFSVHSGKKVWWVCNEGHEWEAPINIRTGVNQAGCPYCSGRYATKERNLAILNPDLAREWHPVKNGTLKPNDVTPRSHRVVWWLCKEGHEWKAIINNRFRGNGCPFCAGKIKI